MSHPKHDHAVTAGGGHDHAREQQVLADGRPENTAAAPAGGRHDHAVPGAHAHDRQAHLEGEASDVAPAAKADENGHGHSHGVIDSSIVRSRAGLRAVALSLGVLLATTILQLIVFLSTGSVALLADLIHNGGDALTAIPLGVAFLLRSRVAEKRAGYFVVATIFISAAVAAVTAINRLINPTQLDHLGVLAIAGAVGFIGNEVAAQIRLRAGRRMESPALIADGNHARVDGFVSLAVVASAIVVALGLPVADPLIGLTISAVILRITWQSWGTVRADRAADDPHGH
jgi:Co/Zn/Cd efflux system component